MAADGGQHGIHGGPQGLVPANGGSVATRMRKRVGIGGMGSVRRYTTRPEDLGGYAFRIESQHARTKTSIQVPTDGSHAGPLCLRGHSCAAPFHASVRQGWCGGTRHSTAVGWRAAAGRCRPQAWSLSTLHRCSCHRSSGTDVVPNAFPFAPGSRISCRWPSAIDVPSASLSRQGAALLRHASTCHEMWLTWF